jgi:hypothetical protein
MLDNKATHPRRQYSSINWFTLNLIANIALICMACETVWTVSRCFFVSLTNTQKGAGHHDCQWCNVSPAGHFQQLTGSFWSSCSKQLLPLRGRHSPCLGHKHRGCNIETGTSPALKLLGCRPTTFFCSVHSNILDVPSYRAADCDASSE